MRLLDLFCGAGGAGWGYHLAGWDVVGVDIAPQTRYPFEFHLADAMTFPLGGFDAIHASPPCQGYSQTLRQSRKSATAHPLLIATIRDRLVASGVPWVIENVSGAPMGHYLLLCGTLFDLRVYRHRQFETSHLILTPQPCKHPRGLMPGYMTIYGNMRAGAHPAGTGGRGKREPYTLEQAGCAMGIDWMKQKELAQAIPPAYTEFLGRQLLDIAQQRAA